MSIQPPKPVLSDIDQKLLAELVKILSDERRPPFDNSNLADDFIALNEKEVVEIANQLDSYFKQRLVRQSVKFVEILGGDRSQREEDAREIFLSMRRERGRTRVMATKQWVDFQRRLGISWGFSLRKSEEMSFQYFLSMERKLLKSLRIPFRIREEIIELIKKQEEYVIRIRNGLPALTGKSIRHILHISESLSDELKHQSLIDGCIPKRKLLALTALISDLSVLFVSRDWSVAGTISAMSAAAAELSIDESK